MPHDATLTDSNRRTEETAVAFLRELISQVYRGNGKATSVCIRIPVHGGKLNDPIGWVERKV